MSEQVKKQRRISDFLNVESKQKFLCYCIQSKEKKIFTEKERFKEKREWRIEQKTKIRLLSILATLIIKDPKQQ